MTNVPAVVSVPLIVPVLLTETLPTLPEAEPMVIFSALTVPLLTLSVPVPLTPIVVPVVPVVVTHDDVLDTTTRPMEPKSCPI